MSRINGRDYIYLVWKCHSTRQRYIVGELSQNGKYEFKYRISDVNKAIQNGFEPLIAFPNINEVYESNDVFPAFSSRLPDKRRRDIREILAKYKLERYDTFELLKKSGGKLPTDSLEFIDPIFLDEANIVREFYIAGVKFHDYCNKKNKTINFELKINENLILEKDPSNEYDEYAIKVKNKENKVIGFIPIFFSKPIGKAIDSKRKITCVVIAKECSNTCAECIKVRLNIL
ncbi:HipA N-terminal domain-containing protein [Clostridium amylolyticum]|uniref:HipA N-terminal domain-containing protein n=1 Tax=Clostridium amylolyticum TaxID=1121298 RepID=A0A1M6HMY5_9CLOT|nr:HIRAN domain-containing protein [Clostridium amylolyticum]SHJ23601.1 HipA N-terminal domain-containing protein [Clostridium amylolyticum]